MKLRKILAILFIVFIVMVGNAYQGFSQDDPLSETEDITADLELEDDASLEEEMEWLQAETYVITASKVLENIKKSAASITVITDKEIRQMGARHLMDVLQTVPGMSYFYYTDGQYKIDARGIFKSLGQHVLIMVNSHPLNENFLGGATWTHDTIIVDNIQRIEVIRGPGSALYGANAFAGVINIITKNPEDIDTLEVTARGGSYNTQQYNVLFGETFNDLGIVCNFNYLDTDGFEGDIEQDRQTLLDQITGTNASLAPGHTKAHDEKYDVALTLQYKGFKLDGRYVDRDRDQSIGMMHALNEESVDPSKDYYVTLSYEGNLREGLDITGKVYRNHHYYDSSYQLLPDGTVVPTPEGMTVFPDGLIAEVSNKNNRTGTEIHTTYKWSDTNTAVVGITYEKMEQYDVEYAANFLYYTPMQNVFIPLPSVQDVTDTQNYNKEVDRTFSAAFLEDLWDIKDNLRLTIGARYDHYSDFGGSFNPRAGLIWEFIKGYDMKLLYGRAFRAPSFTELYSQNNPSLIGNPDLDPETVDTYEISFGAEITDALDGRITGFYNMIKNGIEVFEVEEGTYVFQNKDELRSQGIETEIKYDFGKGTYVAANFTYQDSENLDTDEHIWEVPEYKGNVMANIRLSKYFNFHTGLYFQGGYTRKEEDSREDLPGFTIVNTTLIARRFIEGLELRGSVYNLFDEEYFFPTALDTLPDDQPMPGRNFLVELRYTF